MAVQPSDIRRPALAAADPEFAALVNAEERLQADALRLIPSENYVSAAVLEAPGTVLQNKYSEGYPGKRYYEGQQVIDQVETLVFDPSGIRVGTPALTSRGIPASQMGAVAQWIDLVVDAARTGDKTTVSKVRDEVRTMMDAYPAPGLPLV